LLWHFLLTGNEKEELKMNKNRIGIFIILLGIIFIFAVSCGVEVTPKAGLWRGHDITFNVSADGTKITAQGSKLIHGCSLIPSTHGEGGNTEWGVYDDIPIDKYGGFSYRNTDLYIEGKFTSPVNASGKAEAHSAENGPSYGIWDAKPAEILVQTFTGHSELVRSAAFSSDGRFIISGSFDKTLILWDTATGKELKTFKGHAGPITSVAFSADGNFVLSGSMDRTMKLWDMSTAAEIRSMDVAWHLVYIAVSPDGKYLLSNVGPHDLKLWEASTGKEVRSFPGESGMITCVAFSPDGNFIASGSSDATVMLWDPKTGKLLGTLILDHRVSNLAISQDGKYLLAITGFEKTGISLWEIATGSEVQRFDDKFRLASAIAFSPQKGFVLFAGDKSLIVYDIAHRKDVCVIEDDTHVTTASFSPDGRYALYGLESGALKLWDLGLE
jgi:WD40 repeat protein